MPTFFLHVGKKVYLCLLFGFAMRNKTKIQELFKITCHVIFITVFLWCFGHFSFLRPAAFGAIYKEYFSASIVLLMLYSNYLVFIPQFYLTRKYKLFLFLFLTSLLATSAIEMLIIIPNITKCYPSSFNEHDVFIATLINSFFVGCRNLAFLLFFFVLRIFEHERETLEKERIALVKNKGIICVPNGKNIMETISISDISCILHERNYTYLYTNDGNRYCKYCSLSSMEELLPENLFIRVNRNAIIPLNKITRYTEDSVSILYGNPAQEISFTLSEKYVPNIREKIASAVGLNLSADGLNVQNDGLNGRSGGLNEGINKANLEEFMDNIAHNEDLLILCQIIAKDPSVTMKSLSDQLGISLKTVERRIKILKDKGILQHSGAKKNGEYVFASSIPGSVINWLTTD